MKHPTEEEGEKREGIIRSKEIEIGHMYAPIVENELRYSVTFTKRRGGKREQKKKQGEGQGSEG